MTSYSAIIFNQLVTSETTKQNYFKGNYDQISCFKRYPKGGLVLGYWFLTVKKVYFEGGTIYICRYTYTFIEGGGSDIWNVMVNTYQTKHQKRLKNKTKN